MKKTCIGLFSLLTVMSAMGQSRLNVTFKNGSNQWYQMQGTKISFEGSQVVFAEKSGSRASFAFGELSKLTISETPASVEKVTTRSRLSVCLSRQDLRFKGVTSDDAQLVVIYNLNGQSVFTAKQSLNEPVRVTDLSKGIYLIRTQNQTIKFVK